jgi:hypothetical protein
MGRRCGIPTTKAADRPRRLSRSTALEERARGIPDVVDVHNLLHLPGTPAPTRTDTPAAQRKTRRSGATPARPRKEPRRVNADKTAAKGETPPDELAKHHTGRRAAPMGSQR